MEIYKNLTEYSWYKISNFWNVFSIKNNKVLSKWFWSWYYQVTLKWKSVRIHRLVAKYFIWDIEWKIINHIDWNKLNNHFSNLEIWTHLDNMKHAKENNLMCKWKSHYLFWKVKDNHHCSKKVWVYSIENIFLEKYNSIIECAEKLWLNKSHITNVCKWHRKTHSNLIFKYI